MGADKNSGLSFPNYQKIANSHSVNYTKILNHNKLTSKLSKIINSKKLKFVGYLSVNSLRTNTKSYQWMDKSGKSIHKILRICILFYLKKNF